MLFLFCLVTHAKLLSVQEFEHAADEHPDHAAGHIIYQIRTIPHPRFERKGNDLHYTQTISLLEALTGFKKEISHLDGHIVPLTSDKVTPHGQVLKISKEGMPHHGAASTKGDLYVKYVVEFPKTLTNEQKDGFATIFK